MCQSTTVCRKHIRRVPAPQWLLHGCHQAWSSSGFRVCGPSTCRRSASGAAGCSGTPPGPAWPAVTMPYIRQLQSCSCDSTLPAAVRRPLCAALLRCNGVCSHQPQVRGSMHRVHASALACGLCHKPANLQSAVTHPIGILHGLRRPHLQAAVCLPDRIAIIIDPRIRHLPLQVDPATCQL